MLAPRNAACRPCQHFRPNHCRAKQRGWPKNKCGWFEKVNYTAALKLLAIEIHENAKAKGFWDGGRNDGEAIALVHSELSEALEALRNGNGPSGKLQGFSEVEEEYADAIIRILDHAEGRGWDVAGAIAAKMEVNAGRPRKHGKRF